MPSSAFEKTTTIPVIPKAPARTFAAGEKVFHPKFGEGQITAVTDRSGDQELAVEFNRHGMKRLLGSLANLEVIN